MTRLILSALALGAALASAAPAFAQDEVNVHVSYADLNLASTAGARVFHQRLKAAVTEICGLPDWSDMVYGKMIENCRRETSARADAVERVALASYGKTMLASATGEKPAR